MIQTEGLKELFLLQQSLKDSKSLFSDDDNSTLENALAKHCYSVAVKLADNLETSSMVSNNLKNIVEDVYKKCDISNTTNHNLKLLCRSFCILNNGKRAKQVFDTIQDPEERYDALTHIFEMYSKNCELDACNGLMTEIIKHPSHPSDDKLFFVLSAAENHLKKSQSLEAAINCIFVLSSDLKELHNFLVKFKATVSLELQKDIDYFIQLIEISSKPEDKKCQALVEFLENAAVPMQKLPLLRLSFDMLTFEHDEELLGLIKDFDSSKPFEILLNLSKKIQKLNLRILGFFQIFDLYTEKLDLDILKKIGQEIKQLPTQYQKEKNALTLFGAKQVLKCTDDLDRALIPIDIAFDTNQEKLPLLRSLQEAADPSHKDSIDELIREIKK